MRRYSVRPRFRPQCGYWFSREAAPETGLLIFGHRPPARISLRPWFEDATLTATVKGQASSAQAFCAFMAGNEKRS